MAGALGAEVRGCNLRSATAQDCGHISELLLEHQVLFFPDQPLTEDEHVRLGRFFGSLEAHPNLKRHETSAHPEIFELRASTGGVADEWHTDLTFRSEPSRMSILHMAKCPPVGGDTLWASLSTAYDALSPPMKELCDGLTALHDASAHLRPEQTAIHPVVRRHPVTGRKLLYVSEHFTRRIVEMNYEESAMLLAHLTRWVQKPEFTVRYRWREGGIAIWDNTQTQHRVLQDFEGERVIRRVTVSGDKPAAACAARWEPFVRTGSRITATIHHDVQLYKHLKALAKL